MLAQPQAHGWIQPHLGAPEDSLRQPRFGGLPQQILGLGAAQFVLPGHAGRTLDEAVVGIGAADFEAVGHAHAIGITKDVVRQVGVQIDVADLIQQVPGLAASEEVHQEVGRIVIGELVPKGVALRHSEGKFRCGERQGLIARA